MNTRTRALLVMLAVAAVGGTLTAWAHAAQTSWTAPACLEATFAEGAEASPPPPPPPADPEASPPPPPPSPSQPPAAPAPPPGSQPSAQGGQGRPAPAPAPPPGPGDAEVMAGLQALQGSDLPSAREHFEKALALDPNNQVARSRMAYLRFRKLDYAGAAADAEAAARIDPTDSLSYVILGRSRQALGESDRAIAAFSSAADLTSKATTQERLVSSALGHYMRAMQRIQTGESTDVESDLKEVIRVYPKNAYAHYEYGLFLIRAARPAEAVDALQKARDALAVFQPQETWVYPNRRYLFLDSNLRFWHGVALRQAGRLDEAIAELDPLLPKVEAMAGSTMAGQGSATSVALEGKVETSFRNAHYEDALTWEAKGDKARALALVKTLLKLNLADEDTVRAARDLQKRLK